MCAVFAWASASRSPAAAKAANASSRMRSISSGFSASTSTGSYDLFGADISSRASDWLVARPGWRPLDAKVPKVESKGRRTVGAPVGR
ncbi:hypothetical protein SBADM41S_04969 [Streptomyces badius]